MSKRVIIVHRWSGKPNTDWYPWLKSKLEEKGFEVIIPEMPNSEHPKIDEYVSYLSSAVGTPDTNTHFVAHSIGCQTVMRYVASLQHKVGQLVFVGGWFTLQGLEDEETEMIARPWIKTPIDFGQIKKNASHITAIFSDDDEYVDLENVPWFEERLGAQTIVEHGKGHFRDNEGVLELPIVLEQFN